MLADLLSKIKHKEQQGVIPPNLAQVVQRASGKRKVETRIKVVLLVVLLLVACGFGTIYLTNRYLKSVSPSLSESACSRTGKYQERPSLLRQKISTPAAKTETVVQQVTAVQPARVEPVKETKKEEKAACQSLSGIERNTKAGR